jgi:hypothetical protein
MRKLLPQFHAVTNSYSGRRNRIITKASVCDAYDPKSPPSPLPKIIETDALWDTGATGSVITPKIVKALGLTPSGKAFANHGGGRTEQDTYIINLMLPNGVRFPGIIVAEMDKVVDNFGVIIGMDIISVGDFSITNHQGKTCFSFRVPSQGTVDFVKEFNTRLRGAVGPNDWCPCGSNVKFKKCHGGKA